ncbi:MAG: geranylgeranyl reductase family protein [Candidatus Micrarchaeota archaeon]|nr:geranylgeranyl reductase family protein [Candidatus Micrarchaeota archaeon]
MEEYDAVVVGAGPAGTTFAAEAASRGMSVVVIDKKKELGSPVRCGEGIGIDFSSGRKLELPRSCIASDIEGALMFSPNGKSIKLTTPQTKGHVLERKIFDKFLAMEAGRKGAHILPRTMATGLLKENGKIAGVKAVSFGEEIEFKAPLVVSAEGMEAKLAREAGIDALATLYDVDTCYEYEMVNVPCEPFIEIYFGSAAPRGYVWVFPKGKDVANVGIGVGGSSGADPKKCLDEWIARNPRMKKAEIIEVKAGIISVGAPVKKMVADNFMAVGTSAHQVDPVHGGGIALAMKAARIAAEVAAKAHSARDFSEKTLSAYETQWRAAESRKLEKRLLLRKVLEKLSDDDFNAVIGMIDSQDLEKLLSGDFKPIVTKVVAKRPSILKVATALLG